MISLLLSLFILQQISVDAVVDRSEVIVGATVVLTITVEVTGNDPVQILNPSTLGLEILGTSDQSEVSIRDGIATRVLTRTIRLRAIAAGPGRVGAITVRSGESVARSESIDVLVAADEDVSAATLAPRVRRMVERHQPTRRASDEVFVEVLASTDSVVLGEQLDLAVVAWFPQEVRTQLRTPPTLQPPDLQGAWTYSQGVPHAVDMRRVLGGTRYQVYVHPVVVFPLTPGRLEIGPARVSYSLPMSYSFLSREVRHEPQSDSTRVFVAEQPLNGRPSFFEGAAGVGLQITVSANPTELSVGDASVITARLQGEGNVALWPEPRIRWPDGIRAYPEGVEVDLVPDTERITGSKTFRYLVVPDSSGTHLIGQVAYPYYDLTANRYVTLRASELPIVAEFSSTPTAVGLRESRLLMQDRQPALLARLVENLPIWIWVVLVVVPPLAAAVVLMRPKLRTRSGSFPDRKERALDLLEHEFKGVLYDLVGDAERQGSTELSASLRAAGVDAPIAAHAARVRERIWQANYGPQDHVDPEELTAEVNEVLKALAGQGTNGLALAMICLAVAALPATAQSAERLYEAGALRAAADSFAARTESEPQVVAHWYNLGATWERAGEDERARHALIRAARMSPRNERVRAALDELPRQDITSSRVTRISLITPSEAIVTAICLWILAWLAVAFRLKKLVSAVALVAAFVCAAYGFRTAAWYDTPVALTVTDDVPLRAAPYGPALPRQLLAEGTAVIVARTDGPWMLVRRGDDSGWILGEEVVVLQ